MTQFNESDSDADTGLEHTFLEYDEIRIDNVWRSREEAELLECEIC